MPTSSFLTLRARLPVSCVAQNPIKQRKLSCCWLRVLFPYFWNKHKLEFSPDEVDFRAFFGYRLCCDLVALAEFCAP